MIRGQESQELNEEKVIFERRILLGCTALVGLSACIWAVAIGTDHWFTVKAPNDEGLPLGDSGESGRRLIYKHMGLWRGCVSGLIPKTKNSSKLVPYSECKYQEMFPPESKIDVDPGLDRTVIKHKYARFFDHMKLATKHL
ncbi:hypothetical protein HZH68_013508 [Vespula germanica]|uniref:Uncharacterized protein n=2 Tax=Vespula TaxID=7451 RepID=A0A834JD95_VESGE|nr:hypothetical protein HZH68_013508 [Vespula germanica]KAF7406922.1 hypothetical protein H0235_014578 [Vespula pensylvanica]